MFNRSIHPTRRARRIGGLFLIVAVLAGVLLAGGAVRGNPAAAQSVSADAARQVAQAAGWGKNVAIEFDGDTLLVRSNGLPDHEILPVYQAISLVDNETVFLLKPEEQRMRVAIPLQPTLAAQKTPTNIGIIGIAISGGVLYSPFEADGTTLALDDNFVIDGVPFLDTCNGHPNPLAVQYHYHGIPYCITEKIDTAGQHSRLLGYLLDGFPVYGPQDEGGVELTPADLDECNGHSGPTPEFPGGTYHYHMTAAAPYSIPCYSGAIDVSPSPLALLTRGVDLAPPSSVDLGITPYVPGLLVLILVNAVLAVLAARFIKRKPLAVLATVLVATVAVEAWAYAMTGSFSVLFLLYVLLAGFVTAAVTTGLLAFWQRRRAAA